MDRTRAGFWNWIARRYARQAIADEASYREKLRLTREYFSSASEVLEFGCGTATTAIAHAPFVKHIRATDISTNMLAIGRERAAEAGVDNVSFAEGELQAVAGDPGQWDIVLGLNILHLVPDLGGELARVRQALKPGGLFVSSTPCIGDFSATLRLIVRLVRWLPFLPSPVLFTHQELLGALHEAGFVIEKEWSPGPGKAVFIVARSGAADQLT